MNDPAVQAALARTLRPALRALRPYPVADRRGLLCLDAMENPYPLPAALRRAWLRALAAVEPNRYPYLNDPDWRGRVGAALGVPDDLDWSPGNGSDEWLLLLCLAVLGSPLAGAGRPCVMAAEPGFSMYRQAALACDLDYRPLPLDPETFDLPADAAAQVAAARPALVFLAWPNNPTGNLFDPEAVADVCAAAPGLVVVDEAYQPFAGATLVELARRRPNVLVLRTVSKLGLAGLRFGLLIGRRPWLEVLDALRLPYNIDSLTQASLGFFADHMAVFRGQAERIRRERARLARALARRGLHVWPSAANFITFRVGAADRVHAGLRERGVLVKCLDGAHPALAGCLRVTVGRPADNRRFLAALDQALAELA
ncbi:MAG: histidinol-phosphate aminotransferase 2 [Gammaproteobacteria bacterium]|nr:MAG: histidinol-phosphate aminotransferase 2 [Gammaproteobacteria bacterium]